MYFKGHHKHVRFDFEAGEALARSFTAEDALEAISEYFDPSSCEILRLQPFLFHGSMPKAWRAGRLLLAGDAAHQSPPFSGQGLNMGIRDAVNLAFKFELLFRGLAGPALLDTYQGECWDSLVVTSPTAGTDMGWFREVLGGTVLQLGRDLSDANGELTRWLGRNNASSVLIRPDRYVFETGDDGSSLCRSLRQKLKAFPN